ncbi:MAG TPA: V-type ATP synthase subunit I [Thermoplasmata archaeon]|nr:V-type ATP synthase subunit I [Thermoplasmata archaeon]
MAVLDVRRIVIGCLEKDRKKVVSNLKKLGTVHIDDMFTLVELQSRQKEREEGSEANITEDYRRPTSDGDVSHYEKNLSVLAKATKNLTPFFPKKSFALELMEGIIYGTFNIRPLISKKVYKSTIEEKERVLEKAKEVNKLAARMKELENTIRKLEAERRNFKRFSHLDIPLSLLRDTKTTRLRFGRLTDKVYEKLVNAIKKETKNFYAPVLFKRKKIFDVLVVYLKREAEVVEKKIDEAGFRDVELPEGENTPSNEAEKLLKKIGEENTKLEKLKNEMKKLTIYHLPFLALYDYFSNRKSEYEIYQHFLGTEKTIFISGWVLTDYVDKTIKDLKSKVQGPLDFYLREPEEGETVPTKIEPAAWAKPFSFVTRMYGSPKWGEIDPTPFFAPFFAVFLGFCLSDAGYGIVLLFTSIYASRTLRGGKNFFRVLIWGSVATIFVGALVGSWFGVDLEADIPSSLSFIVFLRDFLRSIRAIDLTKGEGILTFFILSLGLGVIQIFTGLFVKMYWNMKRGRVKEAIFDQGFWMVFLAGLLGYLTAPTIQIFKFLFFGGMILLILTQGRHHKNPIMKLVVGTLSLYDLTKYFSDILSYSRLLALGLATGIVALIINLLGFILYEGISSLHPVLGPVIAIVVVAVFLVIAHIANIALNLLSAIIHTLRLQYIEYFSKFYKGGGKPFNPFKEEFKKVDITS